ncbi:hypothetical protein BHE74_00053155 [Ensete ventricosum]|nr:hypothetical protein BHE74_00053155 [Ensete ventricosum]RZR91019.1 hypothetical protein BHM03_00019057 [Ensete ventricosum]
MDQDEEKSPNDSDPLIWRQTESSRSPEGLDEIKDDEADTNSSACCRICLESDTFPGDLILLINLFVPFCLRSFLVNLSFIANSCYI